MALWNLIIVEVVLNTIGPIERFKSFKMGKIKLDFSRCEYLCYGDSMSVVMIAENREWYN